MMNIKSNTALRHIINISDLSDKLIDQIINRAQHFVEHGYTASLQNRIIATIFLEPSTRTRLSFASAVCRAGGQVISVDQADTTSLTKGESLEDMIKVVSSYADVIVLRHPEAGSAQRAAAVATVPVINAGDGPNAHPTQTLLDLFTIQQALGRTDQLTIGLVGDLKYSRVAHSMAEVLARAQGVTQYWIAPEELMMPDSVKNTLKQHQGRYQETTNLLAALPKLDIVMMTRVQKERFQNPADYERLKNSYILEPEHLTTAQPSLKILAPLPRTEELPPSLDALPQAYYFTQASFGVPVRAALLEYCLAA